MILRKGTIILSALLIFLADFIMPVVYAQPADTQQQLTAPTVPEISAVNAVVIELKTGRVLYEKNAHQKAYPASITKIMTALLAIESGDLDRKVKISKNASGIEGSSIYLVPGEEISLRDLLYGLMLRSGNDSAVAIAESVSGKTEDFVVKMNERAEQIGALNTRFINPSGLFKENHYTTAYDMAIIAKEAMQYPEFKEIARAKSHEADRELGRYRHFYNKNKVVFEYEGGTGIKIGFTKASGRTLVASSERNGMELICVVMNAPDWFNDSYKLMDYVYDTFEMVKVAEEQRILKAVKVQKGDKDHVLVCVKKDVFIPMQKGAGSEVSVAYIHPSAVRAPLYRWLKAGSLEIFLNGELVFSEPLYFMEDIRTL